jgi:hypothetical protein
MELVTQARGLLAHARRARECAPEANFGFSAAKATPAPCRHASPPGPTFPSSTHCSTANGLWGEDGYRCTPAVPSPNRLHMHACEGGGRPIGRIIKLSSSTTSSWIYFRVYLERSSINPPGCSTMIQLTANGSINSIANGLFNTVIIYYVSARYPLTFPSTF